MQELLTGRVIAQPGVASARGSDRDGGACGRHGWPGDGAATGSARTARRIGPVELGPEMGPQDWVCRVGPVTLGSGVDRGVEPRGVEHQGPLCRDGHGGFGQVRRRRSAPLIGDRRTPADLPGLSRTAVFETAARRAGGKRARALRRLPAGPPRRQHKRCRDHGSGRRRRSHDPLPRRGHHTLRRRPALSHARLVGCPGRADCRLPRGHHLARR